MRALQAPSLPAAKPAPSPAPKTPFLISKSAGHASEAERDAASDRQEFALLTQASNTWFDDAQLRSIAASKLAAAAHRPNLFSGAPCAVTTLTKRSSSDVTARSKRQQLLPSKFAPPPPAPSYWKPTPSAHLQQPELDYTRRFGALDAAPPIADHPAHQHSVHPPDRNVAPNLRRSPRVQGASAAAAPAVTHSMFAPADEFTPLIHVRCDEGPKLCAPLPAHSACFPFASAFRLLSPAFSLRDRA